MQGFLPSSSGSATEPLHDSTQVELRLWASVSPSAKMAAVISGQKIHCKHASVLMKSRGLMCHFLSQHFASVQFSPFEMSMFCTVLCYF